MAPAARPAIPRPMAAPGRCRGDSHNRVRSRRNHPGTRRLDIRRHSRIRHGHNRSHRHSPNRVPRRVRKPAVRGRAGRWKRVRSYAFVISSRMGMCTKQLQAFLVPRRPAARHIEVSGDTSCGGVVQFSRSRTLILAASACPISNRALRRSGRASSPPSVLMSEWGRMRWSATRSRREAGIVFGWGAGGLKRSMVP